MTNLMKLTVLTLLAGTVSVIGCSDDDNGTGGSGGTAGTGGSGGAACVQDCGEGNEFPTGANETSETFTCDLTPTVPLVAAFEVDFAGIPEGDVTEGAENTFNMTFQATVPADLANTLIGLGTSDSDVTALDGTMASSQGSTDTAEVTAMLATPCTLCFEEDTANTIVAPTTAVTYTLDDGDTQGIRLGTLTLTVEGPAGPVTFSNAGDEPDCFWGVEGAPVEGPDLLFPAGGGGAGGMGGMGGMAGAAGAPQNN